MAEHPGADPESMPTILLASVPAAIVIFNLVSFSSQTTRRLQRLDLLLGVEDHGE